MNEPKKFLRIAIASDLHFIDGNKSGHSARSKLALNSTGGDEPLLWKRLCDVVKSDEIKADLLLSPGDITTFADNVGLKYAWKKLHELGSLLSADIVGVATGNHDVQTRPPEFSTDDNVIRALNLSTDLTENLRKLDPPYPIIKLNDSNDKNGHKRRVHYFGADYLIYDEHPDYRLVIFNSCARHTTDKKEYERGRIADSTLEWLENELKEKFDNKNKKIGIFLCHHHPMVHEEHNLGSYDQMQKGTELMTLLLKYGDWLIVHGHKHHAKISYSPGGTKKATVFAAGTLSAHESIGENGMDNQFYVLEVGILNSGIVGKVNTWRWTGSSWETTRSRKAGVYSGTGFGQTKNLADLADDISKIIQPQIPYNWTKLQEKIPNLKYLLPTDICHMKDYLEALEIDITFTAHDEIESLTKGEVST